MLERYAVHKSAIGLDQDQHGRDGDHRAFEHGCEEFGLVVTERMIGVGRLGAHADGDKAAMAVMTLTMLSRASENSATEPETA